MYYTISRDLTLLKGDKHIKLYTLNFPYNIVRHYYIISQCQISEGER